MKVDFCDCSRFTCDIDNSSISLLQSEKAPVVKYFFALIETATSNLHQSILNYFPRVFSTRAIHARVKPMATALVTMREIHVAHDPYASVTHMDIRNSYS